MTSSILRILLLAATSCCLLGSCTPPPKNANNMPWNNQTESFEGARYSNFPGTR